MAVLSFDDVIAAFLNKITEFDFMHLPEENREAVVDGYLKRAASAFRKNCKYDLTDYDDALREFLPDIRQNDVDELVEILSEGMLVQWMKQCLYKQELLELTLNTADFSSYSPAEMLRRVGDAYERVQKDYTQMIREYSYNHGNLRDLHL
ncbi:MAG: hypothetical protein LUD69_07905 [Oscillospiraceae bacterium]|nr:hypothetical protein [Oscillospiraceae bacterium]